MLTDVVALAVGYFLGSLLPAYVIGRTRGLDIRATGDGNPGATNAMRALGRTAGYTTAVYDMLKGVVAVGAAHALGASEWATYCAGIAAFLGHRFPFYLRFRGGRGFATASGLLIVGLGYTVVRGWLPPLDGVVFLGAFVVLWWVFGDRAAPDATVIPLAYVDILVRGAPLAFVVPMGCVVAYVWLHNFGRVRREKVLRLWPETTTARRRRS